MMEFEGPSNPSNRSFGFLGRKLPPEQERRAETMNLTTKAVWKLMGATAVVVAAAMFVSMLPDLRRYLKIESM
ncbi:MAG TPA: hypothetical protein VGK24_01740 [Candidatus Angelobacter sp.]|jgi:hypothetical protein